jgi:hypothetical protein
MQKMIIRTHILHKTAYLLAFWGFNHNYGHVDFSNADKVNILQSACHLDMWSVTTYLGDAGTLKQLLNKISKDDPCHKVSEWEPIHMMTLDAFAALNIPSKKYIKSIIELAKWYVFDKLDIPSDSSLGLLTYSQIHGHSIDFVADLSSEQEYTKQLQAYLLGPVYQNVVNLINKSNQAHVVQVVQHAIEIQQVSTGAIILPAATPSPHQTDSTKHCKYNPDKLIQCSKDFQSMAAKRSLLKPELLDIIVQAVGEVVEQKQQGKILQDPLKTWAYKVGKIYDCFQCCHSCNKDSFLAANPNFTSSQFKYAGNMAHSFSFDQMAV